jgi:hypothetical protein
MTDNTRRWLVAGVVFLTAVVLIVGTALILLFFFATGSISAPFGPASGGVGPMRPFGGNPQVQEGDFSSNGEQIYFTGTSRTGPPITASMEGMHTMPSGRLACVNCHGPDGKGGVVRMMMASAEAPNIQYSELTSGEHEGGQEEHPAYTDETIKRAITEGVDPAGEPLDPLMPRWNMSDEQLNDLITFLKTLD